MITLFHGSSAEIRKPLALAGRQNLDFGRGCYLPADRAQALSRALRPMNARKTGFLSKWELDFDAVKSGWRVKVFEAYDEEWLDFVMACRKGSSVWERYGAVQGGTVDDSVFVTMELYTAGLLDRDEALSRLAGEKPSVQICIHEQEIIERCLHLTETSSISVGSEPQESPVPNPTLMQMKYSRVIWLLSKALQIGIPDALDVFYRSETYMNLSEPRNHLHNMGDLCLVDEIILELQRGQ